MRAWFVNINVFKFQKDIEKKSSETEEVYCNRIFKRNADETVKQYKQRVNELKIRLPNLQVWKNDEYKKYVSQYTAKTSTKSSSNTSTKTKTEVTANAKYLVSSIIFSNFLLVKIFIQRNENNN